MPSDKLDPLSRADRPTSVRWLMLVLIGAMSWLLYLHRYAWGVVKPAYKTENPHLTATQLGWLDSSFLATYACFQIPGGLAGDVFGPRIVLALCILLWSMTVAALGMASGFWPLIGILALFGMSQAAAYSAVSQAIRRWFPPGIRTGVQGTVTAMGRLGAACASLIVATLLMGQFGLSWGDALLTLSLPGVLLAAAFWMMFRNSPREHPWTNRAEQETCEGNTPPDVSSSKQKLRLDGPARVSLIMMLVYSFCSTFADMLYVFWIPSFLVGGKGLSSHMMGLFAPLPLVGGAVGGVVGGTLNDLLIRRTGNPRLVRSGVAFTGKFMAMVLLVTSLAVPDGRLVMVLLLGCKFFGDWSLPTLWGTITDMGGKGAGTVFGVVNTIGALGGFVAGPVLGYLKQHYDWDGLFLGVGAAYLAAALCWLFIDCTQRLVYVSRET